ncbi:MAG: succinylglutamate desuccinylase/aspartoacylase family protein [Candidatus Limnocylindria bacterium]
MFLNVPVRRGEVVKQRVPMGELADGSEVGLPVVTIGGARPGPTLYLQAGIHGDELTGIAICRQALSGLDPATVSGVVVAVPVANVPSHLTRTRGFLHEERWLIDINRIFPGNPDGLLTERIAHALFEEFMRGADFTIDLHSALAGCDIAPFVYIDPDDDEAGTFEVRERRGLAFGTPYAYYKRRGEMLGTSDVSRSFSSQAEKIGLPTISAEMGESLRVSWERVPLGVQGIRNVMIDMAMLTEEPVVGGEPRRFSTITLVHAQRGGGLRLFVDLGDEVSAGQEIGEVVDVFGQRVERLEAAADGFILRAMRYGSIATGAEVAWIAA